MRGFYGVQPKVWPGRKPDRSAGPDPYGAEAPGYAERTRVTITKLAGGMVRVDIGEPLAPRPGAPRRTRTAPTPPPGAVEGPPETIPPEPMPLPRRVPARTREGKQWGLNRDA